MISRETMNQIEAILEKSGAELANRGEQWSVVIEGSESGAEYPFDEALITEEDAENELQVMDDYTLYFEGLHDAELNGGDESAHYYTMSCATDKLHGELAGILDVLTDDFRTAANAIYRQRLEAKSA